MFEVPYVGHVFSGTRMTPDQEKVQSVQNWPVSTDATEVHCFLGLASYYRRYVHQFLHIVAPLHNLNKKDVQFAWTAECQTAFATLNQKLTQVPILAWECLVAVYGMKQFRHYLLGRPFRLFTDHAPLKWLSAQKMEGLFCCWSLAMQEYDFTIIYQKRAFNTVADSLSRYVPVQAPSAATQLRSDHKKEDVYSAQRSDPVIKVIAEAVQHSLAKPMGRKWHCPPLICYRKMWNQLTLVDGVVCRKFAPGPSSDVITVPILPRSLQPDALYHSHNVLATGHLGAEKL